MSLDEFNLNSWPVPSIHCPTNAEPCCYDLKLIVKLNPQGLSIITKTLAYANEPVRYKPGYS